MTKSNNNTNTVILDLFRPKADGEILFEVKYQL